MISRKRTGPLLAAVDGRDPSVVDEARLVGLDALDADAALAAAVRSVAAAGVGAARPRVEHGHDGRNAIAQPLELQKHQKKRAVSIFFLSPLNFLATEKVFYCGEFKNSPFICSRAF